MSAFLKDIRYSLRMLAKNPGFTAVAVLSLALGIGGNVTVYSWVQSTLLHPLPVVADSEHVVAIETRMPDGALHTSSYPDYKDFRDQNKSFSGLIGVELMPVNAGFSNDESPERIWGEIVTGNFFNVLGVSAGVGRTFLPEDDVALNAHPVVVLSYALWQGRFGGDPQVIGKTVSFNQHPFTVIGVAPRQFQGAIVGISASFWVPMTMQPEVLPGEDLEIRSPTFVHILGRLKPGVGIAQAQAELNTIARRLEQEYPKSNKGVGVELNPLWKAHYGVQSILRPVLIFLTTVVVLVLLIACANVANLFLARATVREKEIAIRSALGASRSRLIRQFLSESVLLSLCGGMGGVLLALWATNFLGFFLPPAHLPVGLVLGVNSRVLWFSLALSLATGAVFGLVPALQISRPNVNASLKEGGHTSHIAGRHGLRNLLVVSEMMLALVLLTGAGLLVRSLRNARTTSPGFDTNHVLLTALDLRANGYTDAQSTAFFEQLRQRVQALPGVQAVSYERWVPLWFYGKGYTRLFIEGYTPAPNEFMNIDYNVVGPEYFRTLRIPLMQGRDFTEQDRADALQVAIINETMALRYWHGQDPLGKRIRRGRRWITIVGVVNDIKFHSMNENPEAFLYFPLSQEGGTDTNVLVRTAGDPAALLPAVRHEILALDPHVTVLESADLSGLLSVSLFAYRTAAMLASVLGALGLLLATIGIYGVLSYSVSQRTREIGVRVALGARPRDILALVIGQGMRLAVTGVLIGILVTLAATRVMASLLFGVSATDPLTFVVVTLLLSGVALAACWVPARRATRVDPLVALRHE
jgi:putative ABC transport system permease protein